MPLKYKLVFFLTLIFLSPFAFAGELIIQSPQRGAEIKTGELFVSVMANEEVDIDPNSLRIYIDHIVYINPLVKVKGKQITFIYLEPLKEGPHTIDINANTRDGKKLDDLSWEFRVIGNKRKDIAFEGNLLVDTRFENISGSGKELRQEPPYTHMVNFDGVFRYKKIAVPVKLLTNTDENTYSRNFQSKNYFQVGFISNHFELKAGDQNPNYDKLILQGTRVQGVEGLVRSKRVELKILYGILRRGIEGSLGRYAAGYGLPPLNMRPDSTYILSGMYKRSLLAAKLTLLGEEDASTLAFIFSRAKDDTTSIKSGERPAENICAGVENKLVSASKKLRWNTSAAVGFTTNDISRGVVSARKLDSLYKMEVPVDPIRFQKLFTINSTTTSATRGGSVALSTGGTLNILKQVFNAEYRRIGSSFESFANPYLRNDVETWTIGDRAELFQKKVTLAVRYNSLQNNLFNAVLSTNKTDICNGTVFFNLKPTLPQLNINYNYQKRFSKSPYSRVMTADDVVQSFTGGVNYMFKIKRIENRLMLQFTRSYRNDLVRDHNTNLTRFVMAGISQTYPSGLDINFQFSIIELETSARPAKVLSNTYSGRLSYYAKKIKLNSAIGVTQFITLATDYSHAALRSNYFLKFNYGITQKMHVEVEGGLSPYTETLYTINNYNESYIAFRFIYSFL